MKDCIEKYKEKLERGIVEYMNMPLSQRSAEAVDAMIECWERVSGMLKQIDCCDFTREDYNDWCSRMINEDGTHGCHWTINDTDMFNPGYKDYEWNIAMNSMYSDYFNVADKYGVGTAEFFADLAKAFLEDKDAHDKLAAYYHHIVQ